MNRYAVALVLLPVLGGCDQVQDRLGMADPAKQAAEGQAIGSACRHAGRGLEDCYRLNPEANKAHVFAGWKEMNEYMRKNNMEAVAPQVPPEGAADEKPKPRRKLRERVVDEERLRENLAKDSRAHAAAAEPAAGAGKGGAGADATGKSGPAKADQKKPTADR